MSNKNLLQILIITLLVVLIGTEVQANGKRIPINLKFAGSFINNVEHTLADGTPTFPSTIIHVNAKGSPGGLSVIRGFGGRSTFLGPGLCPFNDVVSLVIQIDENPLVMTFRDLSLMFANLQEGENGFICIDFDSGKQEFEIPLDIIGGRGRFKDASGWAVIKGEAEPIDSRGNFNGETGTINGVVIRP